MSLQFKEPAHLINVLILLKTLFL